MAGRVDTATILFRRGTASQWTNVNPVLQQGEPGYETDTGKVKIGDGVTAWNSLTYINNITTSTTQPSSPKVGDVWIQI